MANKVTFDFESGEVIFDTDGQKGVEIFADLKDRQAAIMAAAGFEMISSQELRNDMNKMFDELGLGEYVKV